MGLKTIIFHGLLGLAFLVMSSVILISVDSKIKSLQFNRHQNLHPIQAPFELAYNFQLKNFTSLNILISDISTISFNTPGFPSKLASAAQVGKMLNASDSMTSIVYPIIDNTTKSRILFALSAHDVQMKGGAMLYNAVLTMLSILSSTNRNMSILNTTVAVKQPENIQDIFKIEDTLTLNQTDYYCPIRGLNKFEDYQDWITRTGQKHASFVDSYNNHMQFTYNNIHEQKCHGQRTDSMVMTHVAMDMYNVFSTHSSGTLLLGVTSIGFAFLWFEAINLMYRDIDTDIQEDHHDEKSRPNTLAKEEHRKKEMKLHTLTTLLKLICVFLVVIFLSVDYVYKTSYADWTKNRMIPTSSFLSVFCSSVLTFLILYMHGSFKMIGEDTRMKREIKTYCKNITGDGINKYLYGMGIKIDPNDKEIQENVLMKRGLFPSLDLIREKIESEKEVLLYSYAWFITIPLYFMAWYADKVYGVDLHMQLIILAIIAGCTLDIIYIRMALLIDVVWDIYIKNHRDDRFDSAVYSSLEIVMMPSSYFKNIILWLKFVMWVLFLVVRLTIIIIPYMLLKAECDNECGWLEFFIVVFEVLPVVVPFFDQIRTHYNKNRDFENLMPHDVGNQNASESIMKGTIIQDMKYEYWRVMIYCVVYYLTLTLACIVFCALHLSRYISEKDARAYELVMS